MQSSINCPIKGMIKEPGLNHYFIMPSKYLFRLVGFKEREKTRLLLVWVEAAGFSL